MNDIHSTAFIAPGARIGERNSIGPFCYVGPNVAIGDDNILGVGVVIGGAARQSRHRHTHGYRPDAARGARIGDRCFFEEYVVVHEGLQQETEVGTGVAVGAGTYIAHDVRIREHCTIAAHSAIGGYALLGVEANMGLSAVVHPRCAIGAWAMIGANSVVLTHVVPGATVAGAPARYLKPNEVGLSRAGFTDIEIEAVRNFLARALRPQALRYVEALSQFEHDRAVWGRRSRPLRGVTEGADAPSA